jgi:hypothetical protein
MKWVQNVIQELTEGWLPARALDIGRFHAEPFACVRHGLQLSAIHMTETVVWLGQRSLCSATRVGDRQTSGLAVIT